MVKVEKRKNLSNDLVKEKHEILQIASGENAICQGIVEKIANSVKDSRK